MTEEKPTFTAEEVRLVEVDGITGLRVGESFDEFRIEKLIGRGGVSEVYLADDTRTNTQVALKFLLPERLSDQISCERLRKEAQSIMSLRHRNIVSVVDIRENESTGPFIVMELLEGKNLTEYLPLAPMRALEICSQIADALAYAHGCGMIHRDIKPSNVMLLPDGRVKLVDFGLAKVFEPENPKHIPLTRTTELVGTPLYMSPEQCFGQDLDARSDVYQLGCLLYQCLTGLPPFQGSNSFEAMFKHVSQEANFGDLPAPVVSVLKRAMNKNPGERFQDMSAMALSIRKAMEGKNSAVKGKPDKKMLLALVGIASSLTALLFVLVVLPLTQSGNDPAMAPMSPEQLIAKRYYDQGVDYKLKGWTEQSRQALQQAIKIDKGQIGFKALSYLRSHLPAHPVSQEAEQLNIRAYCLRHSDNDKEGAERLFKQCIALYPDFEWPYSNLGDLYVEIGEPERALPLLEKAVQINPFYTNALRHLSEAHSKLGHREKAIKYMEDAVESDPSDLELKEELSELLRSEKKGM